ncbi:hypothetical protein KM043_013739 [Ampulex compressa]|nr:hypothetical protein KM043_013739 [Ampulex compressa]
MLDAFRRFFMASQRNPRAHKYLRSRASIVLEKRRHLRNHRYTIHPFSIFRHYWNWLIILVITGLLFAVPYQAGFDINRSSHVWTIIKNILLLLCCTDMVVNFMTGYFDKEQRIIIMDRKKIIHRYARHGTFILDILGSSPTDLLFADSWHDHVIKRETASLIIIFRVFSLSSYIGSMARAHDTPLALYEFCIIIFWLLIVLHWQSCLYWIVPIASTSVERLEPPGSDSWIQVADLWDSTRSQQYLSCFLRAVATFLRSGFLRGDPRNAVDLYAVIAMKILGALTVWLLIARVMRFFKGANSSRLRYQGAVAQLKQYMRHKQLPYPTQGRIVDYYEFRFQRRYFREAEILHTLSSQMRQEIGMHSCRKLVENVTFFNNLPYSLLGRIVALLRSEIFLTNDVIVKANQPGNCMYFIATGTVAIYTLSGKEVCHLEDGAHFGEIALVMPDERRVASVVAVEVCELYRLDRADFARTIHPYPLLWERIKKVAIERHEKTTILNAQ